ncbi:hypothetical protein ACN1C3_32950 [Pseudomonas sp. H11T01]|uniref:hypothetical protein n=1 Tax=Pseudomonas sp. H11T01 TaxID=3402749 RepID=UPI003ABFFBCC
MSVQTPFNAAAQANGVAILGIATCLTAPLIGLLLLRSMSRYQPPPMHRWAYVLYPMHFLALLARREALV